MLAGLLDIKTTRHITFADTKCPQNPALHYKTTWRGRNANGEALPSLITFIATYLLGF